MNHLHLTRPSAARCYLPLGRKKIEIQYLIDTNAGAPNASHGKTRDATWRPLDWDERPISHCRIASHPHSTLRVAQCILIISKDAAYMIILFFLGKPGWSWITLWPAWSCFLPGVPSQSRDHHHTRLRLGRLTCSSSRQLLTNRQPIRVWIAP